MSVGARQQIAGLSEALVRANERADSLSAEVERLSAELSKSRSEVSGLLANLVDVRAAHRRTLLAAASAVRNQVDSLSEVESYLRTGLQGA